MRALLTGTAFLILFASSNAQTPNLDPPALLPGSPVVGPAPGSQRSASLAPGAASSLLVFDDERAGDRDIFGVRLGPTGVPIDAVPFPISGDPGAQGLDPAHQSGPVAAWNGQSWLVVYTSEVDNGFGYWTEKYYARRVSAQGQALDAAPILVSDPNQTNAGKQFGLASDGQNWVVLYSTLDASSNPQLRAKRIAPDGTVLDPSGVLVTASSGASEPSAHFAGGKYLFLWWDNGSVIKGRQFTPQLQPADAGPVTLPVGPTHISLKWKAASNGTELLLVWMIENVFFTSSIVGARIDANLNLVGSPSLAVSGTSASDYHVDPTVTWDGTQWIVGWLFGGSQNARAARVSAAGQVQDPGGVVLPDASSSYLYEPAIGGVPGGGAVLAWHDIRFAGPTLYDVFGASLSAGGVAGLERCYSLGSERLRKPRLVEGPAQQGLVSYGAEQANSSRVLVQRVDSFGTAIDPEPLVVASANHPNLAAGGVAWNGLVYLVTWSDGQQGKVFARRLLSDGTWLDPAPIFVLLGGNADAAALGGDFLVTGLRAPSYPQFVYSYGARVRGSDGVVLDNPALQIGQSYAARARVTELGGKWLVVTERHASHDSNQSNVLFHFVTAQGAVSQEYVAATLVNIQDWGSTDVASAGTSALVVFQSGSNWTNTDVLARRILPDGSMPGAVFNVTGSFGGGQSRAAVAWSGSQYAVAYQTLQNNVWFYDLEPDVYASRVSEAGSLLDAAGFALWNGGGWEDSVDGAVASGGRARFAASVFAGPPYSSFRISLRALRPDGLANYGIGTPGCGGPQRMDASGRPAIGSPAFALTCDRAPANALGLGLASDLQDVSGSDPFALGILLHVGFGGAFLMPFDLLGDALGLGTAALPLPNDPLLVGKAYFAQALWGWPSGCVPSPFALSTSDGLKLVIQAP